MQAIEIVVLNKKEVRKVFFDGTQCYDEELKLNISYRSSTLAYRGPKPESDGEKLRSTYRNNARKIKTLRCHRHGGLR